MNYVDKRKIRDSTAKQLYGLFSQLLRSNRGNNKLRISYSIPYQLSPVPCRLLYILDRITKE